MPLTNTTESTTLASACYQRLRSEIRSGRFKPGERLRIQALTEEFKIGLSPVREALNRLAADGLITQSDQRGFRVPPATVNELLELTRTRCAIMDLTLRDSIALGGADWEERVVVANYRISRVRYGSHPEYDAHHVAFHRALISACPSPWLLDFSDTLFELAERYRALAQRVAVETNVEAAMQEHEAIFKAVLARDADTAVRLQQDHIRVSSEMILSTKRLFDEGLIQGEWSPPVRPAKRSAAANRVRLAVSSPDKT